MLRSMGPFLGFAVLALALFALYFVIKSKASTGMKILWIALIVLIPFVGAVAYFLVNGTGAPPSDRTSVTRQPTESTARASSAESARATPLDRRRPRFGLAG